MNSYLSGDEMGGGEIGICEMVVGEKEVGNMGTSR